MRAREFLKDDLSVKTNIDYHQRLNPATWDDDQLKSDIRERLIEIAERFVEYLEIENFYIEDIVLTGSMANFNWTEYSDFDVHVITDYKKLNCDDIAEAFYTAKKKIWNDENDIMIVGHEVEMYVEDIAQPSVSQGTYSLLNDTWKNKPSYNPPKINDSAVDIKTKSLAQFIDKSINKHDTSEELKRLMTKIRNMRKSGLEQAGEFSTENLAFKILRNQGYLDKLKNAILDRQSQELSIK